MNYEAFEEMIRPIPEPESLKYQSAIFWLHPEELPRMVVSIGQDTGGVVKIPEYTLNRYGNRIPVIAIGRDAFAGHDRITDVFLPSDIESIPQGAFSGCTGLKRITIPRAIRIIREGTFAGCDQLEDVYFEGTPEEWRKIEIVHHRHEIEFGAPIPGTPVLSVKAERLRHIPGNDALLTANFHFRCPLSAPKPDRTFCVTARGTDITDLFRAKE